MSNNELAVELLPCPNPWCTASTPEVGLRHGSLWGAKCGACDIIAPTRETEAEAIAAWNTLPPTPSPTSPASVEAVREAIALEVRLAMQDEFLLSEDKARVQCRYARAEQAANRILAALSHHPVVDDRLELVPYANLLDAERRCLAAEMEVERLKKLAGDTPAVDGMR